MFSIKNNSSGFTLVEMMIVIAIISILFAVSLFPYGYYLERGYVERASDGIGQEWILAHRAIRGGIEFDPIAGTHARLLFVFEKGTSEIDSYLLSGSGVPDINNLPTDPSIIRKYKTLILEKNVEILDFTGSLLNIGNKVGYLINPPGGEGSFFTGSSLVSYTGARIIVGYPGANLSSGRAREVLLRTYLK